MAATPSLPRHRRGARGLELDLDGNTSIPSRPSRDTGLADNVGGERHLHLDGVASGGEGKGGERGPTATAMMRLCAFWKRKRLKAKQREEERKYGGWICNFGESHIPIKY